MAHKKADRFLFDLHGFTPRRPVRENVDLSAKLQNKGKTMSAYKKCILFLSLAVFLLYGSALAVFQQFRREIHVEIQNRVFENMDIITSQIDESLTGTVSQLLSLLSQASYARPSEKERWESILTGIDRQVAASSYLLGAQMVREGVRYHFSSLGTLDKGPAPYPPQTDRSYLTRAGDQLEINLTARNDACRMTLYMDATVILREVVGSIQMENAILLPSNGLSCFAYRGTAQDLAPLFDDGQPFQRKSMGEADAGGKRLFLIRMPVHALSSSVWAVFDRDEMFARDAAWNRIILSVSLLAFACFAAGCLILHVVIHRPLHRLVDAFAALDRGDLEVKIPINQRDEFQYIFHSFNQMTEGLKNVIDINYDQVIRIQRAKLSQLYLQVNPHFLYNCFSNISSLCACGEYEAIKPFTRRLASYYRYITSGEEADTSFASEYRHALDYIEIQRIRFGGRIQADYTPLKELSALGETRVPKLIIQPLIENSYKHALEKMPGGGRLCLSAALHEGTLEISVQDNGRILDDESIARLETQMRSDTRANGIGLANVCRRLQLYYRDRAWMSLKRGSLGGLEVTIHIEGVPKSC